MIRSVEISESSAARYGLGEIRMHNLGQIVVLVGENGSGKSRLLNLINDELPRVRERSEVEREMKPLKEEVAQATEHKPLEHPDNSYLKGILQTIAGAQERIRGLGTAQMDFSPNTRILRIVPNAFAQTEARAASAMPYEQYLQLMQQRPGFNLENSYRKMERTLSGLALAAYLKEHPVHRDDSNVANALASLHALNELLEPLLACTLGYTLVGNVPRPALSGRLFNTDDLSPGQRIIVAWALSLFEQSSYESLSQDAVLFVDEPEMHLHPAACQDVLKRVFDSIVRGGNRQIWIATHSVALLASLSTLSDVYLVEGRSAKYANRQLTHVVDGLLGGVGARETMMHFLDDVERVEFYGFVAQCLLDAGVSGKSGDAQSLQFAEVVKLRRELSGKVRVLDYASGKGRFSRSFAESEDGCDWLDYHAYDDPAFDRDRATRIENLRALYPNEGTVEERCHSDISDLYFDARVDIVVMANFLHEVEPQHWSGHLQHAAQVLRDDGWLLVCEDLRMPVGELPHSGGYLVMNLAEMRTLLGSSKGVQRHPQSTDRCQMIGIEAAALREFASQEPALRHKALVEALQSMRKRGISELARLRRDRDGRGHARSLVQLANAVFALERLGAQ